MALNLHGTTSVASDILTETQLRDLSRRAKELVPLDNTGGEEPKKHFADGTRSKYVATFHSIINTASSDTLAAPRQVAAWNALSTFIDQLVSAKDTEIRNILWTEQLWQASLHIFLLQSQGARPKSTKQLLTSLTDSLQKSQNDLNSSAHRDTTARLLVEVILQQSTRWPVRSSLLLFSNLLRKGIIQLSDLCAATSSETTTECTSTLLEACMHWAVTGDCASTAGQLLAVLLDKAATSECPRSDKGEPLWVSILVKILSDHPDHIDAFRLYLMPVLFKRDPEGFMSLIDRLKLQERLQPPQGSPYTEDGMLLLLAILQVGKDCGLVEISDKKCLVVAHHPLQLPISILASLLRHADRSVRLAGLSLLVNSHVMTKAFQTSALAVLKANLPHLHADTDLQFRSELFAVTQRLFDRLRASTADSSRSRQSSLPHTSSAEHVYVLWYQRFLSWELRPGASYQRHISALRCIGILMRSGLDQALPTDHLSKSASKGGKWPFNITIVTSDLEELLVNLLLDSFDDVRQTAAGLLSVHFQSLDDSKAHHHKLEQALVKAERLMLASGRADQADAVAHIHSLLFTSAVDEAHKIGFFIRLLDQTEQMLDVATSNLAVAVERYPLHGLFISLRYLLDKAELRESLTVAMYQRLAGLLTRVWLTVKATLCDDAPEGFLPEDLPSTETVSTKEVLSYCWRALKEASLLTDTILLSIKANNEAWAHGLKLSLIELTFTQLAELRHRGAFSTVAQTWARCCTLAEGVTPLSSLFDRVLLLIQKATINTRRSAGMPSLLCGILIAERTDLIFDKAFAKLDSIARQPVQPGLDDESSLPQVHAMNCLKDILKNTKLAEKSERHVSTALQLAADSLPSRTWAIRNCGLMLFRAVIDRLLGTNDSYEDHTLVKNFMDFRQHRMLLDQVLTLLPSSKVGLSDLAGEGIFPALQLLQHSVLPEDCKGRVQLAMFALIGSDSWHIRDKAARTLVTALPLNDILKGLDAEIEKLHTKLLQNRLHGLLLCLKYIVREVNCRRLATSRELLQELLRVHSLAQDISNQSGCPVILSAAQSLAQDFHDLASATDDTKPSVLLVDTSDNLSSLRAGNALQQIIGPAAADKWLIGRSAFLEGKINTAGVINDELLQDIEDWTTASESVMELKSVFTGEAASIGLRNLHKTFDLLYRNATSRQVLVRLCLLVYDLLFDDDEQVRITSAVAASNIIAVSEQSSFAGGLEPLVASHKLLRFMTISGRDDTYFASQCLRRAFRLDSVQANDFPRLLEAASQQDDVLFAEEKQNLYADDTLEAKSWSQAAQKLSSTAFQRDELDVLAIWVEAGLDALSLQAQITTPGPFGPSTNEAVFALGLRVIYGAELLLHLTSQRVRLHIRPSTLKEKLLNFQVAAQNAALHPIWLIELERVSKIAAVSGFSAVQSLLNGLVGGLASATTLQ